MPIDLAELRGPLKERRPNARSTAALLDNPACVRRSVLDSAGIDLQHVAEELGSPPKFGQSPFALGQGSRFERRVKADGYRALVEVLRTVGFELPDELATVVVSRAGAAPGLAALEARAAQTSEVLLSIAAGDLHAPNVIDRAVTILDIGGSRVYLEQDALAFRLGDKIQICEIKGFPIVDGHAEPEKVGAAARQSAVYLASLQDTLSELGADPELVSPDVVLICTRNYGLQPTARTVNVSRELRALRRQLRRKREVGALLDDIGGPELIARLSERADDDLAGRAALLLSELPYHFVPRCISDCDLARVCRREAEENCEPGRLGDEVQNLIAGLGDIELAAQLAAGAEPPAEAEEVTVVLRRAKAALASAAGLRANA